MNNEKKLYCYIKEKKTIHTDYNFLSKEFDVSKTTIKNWKNKLVKEKYIKCICKYVNNKKTLILSIKK